MKKLVYLAVSIVVSIIIVIVAVVYFGSLTVYEYESIGLTHVSYLYNDKVLIRVNNYGTKAVNILKIFVNDELVLEPSTNYKIEPDDFGTYRFDCKWEPLTTYKFSIEISSGSRYDLMYTSPETPDGV